MSVIAQPQGLARSVTVTHRQRANILSLDDELEIAGKPHLIVEFRPNFMLVRPKRARTRATQAQHQPIFYSEVA